MLKVVCGNACDLIKQVETESVDLVVTSPPYDSLRSYDSPIDYESLFSELFRVVKKGGVVVCNSDDQTRGGSETMTSFRHALMLREAGFLLNDTMIWHKTNPMPQVRQPRYRQSFEYMFVFSKGKPSKFHPLTVPCKCAGQSYSSTCKQITGGKERKDKGQFLINKQKTMDNVWDFAIAQNKTGRPAVFPVELPLRHIKTWTDEGDLVLDPFCGSGTTGIACKRLNRSFLGFEIDEGFAKMAAKRMEQDNG